MGSRCSIHISLKSITGLLRERKRSLSVSVSSRGVSACFDGIEKGINELRTNFMDGFCHFSKWMGALSARETFYVMCVANVSRVLVSLLYIQVPLFSSQVSPTCTEGKYGFCIGWYETRVEFKRGAFGAEQGTAASIIARDGEAENLQDTSQQSRQFSSGG